MTESQPRAWSNLTVRQKSALVREIVLADPKEPDLRALAQAVRSYILVRHGWAVIERAPGDVEIHSDGRGPIGHGAARTTDEAICIAALRSMGALVE